MAPFFSFMKRRLVIILFIILVPCAAEGGGISGKKRFGLHLSQWFSSSQSWWEISGSSFKSRLDFDETDADIIIVGADIAVTPGFTVRASYGSGDISDGKVTDSDWYLSGVKFSESRSKGTGDTSILEFGMSWRLTNPRNPARFCFYLGYMNYVDDLRITDGVQTLSLLPPPFPQVGDAITGLDSTYEFRWELWKVGLEGNAVKGRWDFAYGAYYLGLNEYRGEAFWNLRTDLRSQPPNFVHDADEGYGLDAFLAVSYVITDRTVITGGYRYFSVKAVNGRDTTFFADNSVAVTPLDEVRAERRGPYASIRVRF